MIKYIILLTSMFVLFSKPVSADMLLGCDNCSEQQMRDLVFKEEMSLSQVEYFYVMDPSNSVLRRYVMSYEFELGYLKEIFTASIPQDVHQAANNYFNEYNNFRANPDDVELQQFWNDFFTGSSNFGSTTQSISSASGGDDDVKVCTWSADFFDFIRSSNSRTNYFRATRTDKWQSVINSYNNFAGRANVTVSVGVINASFLSAQTVVEWPDGAQLNVIRRPYVETFDIVDGSALDCNGNLVPTTPDDASGKFEFPNIEAANDFLDHIDNLQNIQLERVLLEQACRDVPVLTDCVQTGERSFTCSTRVPNCQR